MKTIKVIFENPIYNYITSINPKTTEAEIRKYFIGTPFNLGSYPVEDFQTCINIIILNN